MIRCKRGVGGGGAAQECEMHSTRAFPTCFTFCAFTFKPAGVVGAYLSTQMALTWDCETERNAQSGQNEN